MPGRPWSRTDLLILAAEYIKPDVSARVLAARLGRSYMSLKLRALRLGIGRPGSGKENRKIRLCMTCSIPFASTGPGHRMCDPCRDTGRNSGFSADHW